MDSRDSGENKIFDKTAPLFSESKTSEKFILTPTSVPFDVVSHQNVLKAGGICEIKEPSKKDSKGRILIERLHAPGNKPGSGFGSAKFRELVLLSIQIGCPGAISANASTGGSQSPDLIYSPHIFYLKMGMSPDSPQVSFFETFGNPGKIAYRKIKEYKEKEWTPAILETWSRGILDTIKNILRDELKIPPEVPISLDKIIENRKLILSLADKRADFVKDIFIPELLNLVEADPKNKHPDTSLLDSIYMHLTPTAFQYWKYAIENNLASPHFTRLEHLKLNEPEQVRWDRWNENLKKKPVVHL